MAKDYYLPRSDKKKAMWLSNFAVRLPYYAATLDITPSTLTPEKIEIPPRQDKEGYVRTPISDQTFVPEKY